MKWVRDKTGRFSQRPFYDPEEMDFECEALVSDFLTRKYGTVAYPLTTDDLMILLEQEASDVDFYADLSAEGPDVEGVTEFVPEDKPRVRLDQVLMSEDRRANRQRTTLAHELGHVRFHGFLWAHGQLQLWSVTHGTPSPRCRRGTILGADSVDWMEWQAGYASGAYLMPASPLRLAVQKMLDEKGPFRIPTTASSEGRELVECVQHQFQVSEDAAKIRLFQRGYLSDSQPARSLISAI